MPKPTSIAVDTNFLLDLTREEDVVIDCFDTIKKRLSNWSIVVLPTVILELQEIASFGDAAEKRSASKTILNILNLWEFVPVNFIPVGHGIVEQIGHKLRTRGIIPEEENS